MPHLTPHLIKRLVPLALATVTALVLAGCQSGLPNGGGDAVTPNAVAGEAIEVTALDAPATPAAGAEAGPLADPAADPGLAPPDDPAAVGAETAPETETEAEPIPVPSSPEALACQKQGGDWSGTGLGSLRTCVFPTRDGGKGCTRQSDCDGLCLARSGTCSPIKPLLGCNDILQDNGVRATLCIE